MSQAHATAYSLQACTIWHATAILDPLVLALARGLSKFTRITGASACYWPDQHGFGDVWKGPERSCGGSLTVRMGRIEFIADWRGTREH